MDEDLAWRDAFDAIEAGMQLNTAMIIAQNLLIPFVLAGREPTAEEIEIRIRKAQPNLQQNIRSHLERMLEAAQYLREQDKKA